MALGVSGNYLLKIKFGNTDIALDPSTIQECIIVKDLRKFTPEFKLRIIDTQGTITHLLPSDSSMSKVTFEIARDIADKDTDIYNFIAYRRSPESTGVSTGEYEVRGLLDVPKLFYPNFTRSFNGNISDTLKAIGNELKIDKYELSSSLDISKVVLQPNWTNAQLLNYLASNLLGKNDQSNYRVFISVSKNKKKLICKSYNDLINSGIKYKYAFTDEQYQDYQPAYNYEIIDNYKLLGTLGCYQQKYTYFDYVSGVLTNDSAQVQNLTSLTKYFMVDGNDDQEGLSINNTGRNNDFNLNYKGTLNSIFETRVNDLVKMWITTDGDVNINCGDIIRVMFPQGFLNGKLFSYQYSGDWLVERVVHSFGSTFRNQLLLSRSGVDSDQKNTLIKANKVKK